jgi:hypothetical protein
MTIDNEVRSVGTIEPTMAEAVHAGSTLAGRLWAARNAGGDDQPQGAARTLNLWGDEAALLGRILDGYLGDLRVEISAADDAAMRRDLSDEDELVRSMLDRLA